MPVPCNEHSTLSTDTHIHTDVYTLHYHTYRLTVSHDCLLQTIRARCDLLQHLCVSHYLSVIPHLSPSSSTPASPHSPCFHCSCLVQLPSPQLISLFALFSLLICFLVVSFPLPISSTLLCSQFFTFSFCCLVTPLFPFLLCLFYLWFSFVFFLFFFT